MSRSTATIHMRVWPKDKALWLKLATERRQSLSQFIISVVNAQALAIVQEGGKK